jgi:methylmalonyl-CoA/ethylmalonyl-CoA epimerase
MKLDHIAVAVRDMEEAVRDFEARLGLRCDHIEDVPAENAKVAFFDLGGAHLELITPLAQGSALARSIEQRGEGLHHICLEVQDIEKTMAAMKAAGLRLVTETPNIGAGGNRIVFVHPKTMHGVLIELVEKATPAAPQI